jgi:flavodoxin/Pyruvate/2-oxoacid:ferredoxin oxidoreductase delta subunit
MPRCLIAYFSQGGTTAKIAEAIATGLRKTGWDVDLARIDGKSPVDISRYDMLGIGSPAYYFRLPFLVSDYLRALPRLDGRPAFSFILHGTYAGDAGCDARRALEGKGARWAGSFRARGADRFLGYLKLGYLFSPGHPNYEEIVRAEIFGREIAGQAVGGAVEPAERDRTTPALYRIEQFLTNRRLVRGLYSRLFRVDAKRCTACDICMKLCPVGNLVPGEGGRPVWGRDCLLCLTCEEKCPKEAIASPVTSFLFRSFLRRNIRRAAADPEVDLERVRHRRGRTESV